MYTLLLCVLTAVFFFFYLFTDYAFFNTCRNNTLRYIRTKHELMTLKRSDSCVDLYLGIKTLHCTFNIYHHWALIVNYDTTYIVLEYDDLGICYQIENSLQDALQTMFGECNNAYYKHICKCAHIDNVLDIIDLDAFQGLNYHLIKNNCQHFVQHIIEKVCSQFVNQYPIEINNRFKWISLISSFKSKNEIY